MKRRRPDAGRDEKEEELTEVAEAPLPAAGAHALEGVHAVDAGAPVPAGVTDAVVDICKESRTDHINLPLIPETGIFRKTKGAERERTFVAVEAAEAGVAHAGEVGAGLADAASPRAADVGGDAPHSGRVVGRHGNSAAVDRCGTTRSDFSGWKGSLGPDGGGGVRGHLGTGRSRSAP